MVPCNVTGGCFWEAVFHIYLLYMNVKPCNYSMHYGEAMHVKHPAPMETQIVKK